MLSFQELKLQMLSRTGLSSSYQRGDDGGRRNEMTSLVGVTQREVSLVTAPDQPQKAGVCHSGQQGQECRGQGKARIAS